jgi:hypothetical protein
MLGVFYTALRGYTAFLTCALLWQLARRLLALARLLVGMA